MNRTVVFAKRNLKEMSRDMLSYIFCVGFPLIMMVIMTLVYTGIPKEAGSGADIFRIDNLTGGIIVFGHTFIMLFTGLNVSKDRSGSFLIRLFSSPMKSSEFANGYILPNIVVALFQTVLAIVSAMIVSIIVDYKLSVPGLLMAVVCAIPSAVFFIALGLIFGTLFNEKSAPGVSSIIISLGSFVGGIWFDAEHAGGAMGKVSKCTPFFYATKSIRSAIHMEFSMDEFVIPMIIITASALVLIVLGSVLFKTKMKADLS